MFYVVPNYEFAEVNDKGQIRSSLTKHIYSPYTDKDGYLRCKVWDGEKSRGVYVHRAIALVFVPNPNQKPIVNHIDGVRNNNSIENLEWVSYEENSKHGVMLGNFPKGQNAFRAKYKDKQIHEVCKLLAEGIGQIEVSRLTGIPVTTIHGIVIGRTWGHISEDYKIKEVSPKATDEQAKEIISLLGMGLSDKEILAKIDHPRVNRHTIGNIRLGKTFKHLSR